MFARLSTKYDQFNAFADDISLLSLVDHLPIDANPSSFPLVVLPTTAACQDLFYLSK